MRYYGGKVPTYQWSFEACDIIAKLARLSSATFCTSHSHFRVGPMHRSIINLSGSSATVDLACPPLFSGPWKEVSPSTFVIMVGESSTSSSSRSSRGRKQGGFIKRLVKAHRGVQTPKVASSIPDRPTQTSMSCGPVCVDDCLVQTERMAQPKKHGYFKSTVVDLDHAIPDVGRISDSSIETSSSSSTDDSYQAEYNVRQKRVTFSDVSMRVYAATVSDSPNVSSTYPIGLDWKHTDETTVELDEFEEQRSATGGVLLRGFRRPKRLTPMDRFQRISELSGLSHGEIYELEHARSSRQPRTLPPESSMLGGFASVPVKRSHKSYQVVDIDSGYQCVDI